MSKKAAVLSDATAEELSKISKKNKVSRDKVISKMLEYFRMYGIDPFKHEAPQEEMVKILKRLDDFFRFFKAQEKNTLIPFLEKTVTKENLQTSQEKIMNLLLQENDVLRKKLVELQKSLDEKVLHNQKLIYDRQEGMQKQTLSEVSKMFGFLFNQRKSIFSRSWKDEEVKEIIQELQKYQKEDKGDNNEC